MAGDRSQAPTEPPIGDGAIIRSLEPFASLHGGRIMFHGYDIRPECRPCPNCIHVITRDFLTADPMGHFDLAITNPPYSLALEFVQHSLRWIHEHGRVCMLLRLAFLEGQERGKWVREHMPDVFVLPKRPAFINGKTDSCAYAWMIWHKHERREGAVRILALPAA